MKISGLGGSTFLSHKLYFPWKPGSHQHRVDLEKKSAWERGCASYGQGPNGTMPLVSKKPGLLPPPEGLRGLLWAENLGLFLGMTEKSSVGPPLFPLFPDPKDPKNLPVYISVFSQAAGDRDALDDDGVPCGNLCLTAVHSFPFPLRARTPASSSFIITPFIFSPSLI